MSLLGFEINVNDLPEDQGGDYSPIPAGDYDARIADAQICDTKSGTGQYIKLRLDIVAPSHEGRVLWANLNIKNASQKAEEIGRQQLGQVMRAINLPAIKDTDQLIGGTVGIKVGIRESEQYGAQNEVKAYRIAKTASAAAPAPVMASAPAARPKAPWEK